MNPLYLRAGFELITLITKAVAMYQKGEISDDEFRNTFIEPMRVRVRMASSRWNHGPARRSLDSLTGELDRLEHSVMSAHETAPDPVTPTTPETPTEPTG